MVGGVDLFVAICTCSNTPVSLDSPYTFGPGTPFRVNEIFTNREEYLAEYHQRVLVHCTRVWDTESLFNLQRPARNVMSFFGEGGIGKSALIRSIGNRSVSGAVLGLPEQRAVAVIDFADRSNNSFEAILFRLRASLGRLTKSWPAFDFTFSLYWERKHPGEVLAAYAKRESWITKVAGGTNLPDQIASTVDDLVGGHGAVAFGYRLASRIGQLTTQAVRIRQLRRDLPAFDLLLQESDPEKMLNHLPAMLAYDIEAQRKRRPAFALCLIDTFEQVQLLPPVQGALEDMVARMVYMLPNVFFLAASRRPLQWHDPVRSVGLSFGGGERWPGLAGLGAQRDQFPMDGLPPEEADAYLRERLTAGDGDSPAIPEEIRRRVVASAEGSPLYLELSAALFEQIASRGENPAAGAFGKSFPELTVRTMRDLSADDRQCLRAASLLEAFDADMIRLALPGVSERSIERLLQRRFLHHEPSVWPPYRLHENLRQSILAADELMPDGWTATERIQHLNLVLTHLESIVLAIWSDEREVNYPPRDNSQEIVASFLLTLHAAAEYDITPRLLGYMAYTMRQLGYSQVLASLPEYSSDKAELARLSAVARLCSGQSMGATERYGRMRSAAGDISSGAYAGYACLELGYLAWLVDMDAAEAYYLGAYGKPPELNNSSLVGVTTTGLRRSKYSSVVARMLEQPRSRMEEIRAQDVLGHCYLHNGFFERAAEIFSANLDRAAAAAIPLFVARSARHLALACMWFDAGRAHEAVRRAWDMNEAVDSGIGIAQCDLAAALASALDADWYTAEGRMADARARFRRLGVRFDMLPPDAVDVIIKVGQGKLQEGLAIGEQIVSAQRDGRPVGPPAWSAITALWLGQPDWYDFDGIDWIEPEHARERWLVPLERLTSYA